MSWTRSGSAAAVSVATRSLSLSLYFSFARTFFSRASLGLLILVPLLLAARCGPIDEVGERRIGQRAFEVDARFEMAHHLPVRMAKSPPVQVNTASGNLFLRVPVMSQPNPVHELPVLLAYNSCPEEACSSWRFSFEQYVSDDFFTDATGARHWIGGHEDGRPINGTGMIYGGEIGSETVLRSQNGWQYRFGADGKLRTIRPGDVTFPRIQLQYEDGANGESRVGSILVVRAPLATRVLYEIGYDAAGRVASICDGAGRCSWYEWISGDLVSVYRPNASGVSGPIGPPAFRFSYASGRMASYANQDGNVLRIEYSEGRVTRVTQVREPSADASVNPTHSFAYESGLTRYTDPEGTVFELSFDANDKLVRVENTDTGTFQAWTWNANRPTSFEKNGVRASYEWTLDRLSRETTPRGNVIHYTHDPGCLDPRAFSLDDPVRSRTSRPAVVHASDSLGLLGEAGCDARGRPSFARNGMGEETTFTFIGDSLEIETVTGPGEMAVELSNYTATGHAMWVASPGSWLPDQYRVINAYGMREEGSEALRLGLGDVLRREFDDEGRAVALHMRDGSVFTIEYRGDGQIAAIGRPGGGDSRLGYDALGRLVSLEELVGGSWVTLESYEHDLLGRVTRTVRANGSSTETEYDSDGNPVFIRNLWGTTLESWALLRWEDGRLASRLDSETSPVAPEFTYYDQAGAPTITLHPDGSRTVRAYDLRGRLVSESFESAEGVVLFTRGHGYDLAGRRVRTCDGVCDGSNALVERVIEDGRVATILYANGVERVLSYTDGDLTRVVSTDGAGEVIEETDLSHHREVLDTASWLQLETTSHSGAGGGVEATSFERYEFVHQKLDCTDLGGGLEPCYEFDSLHNVTAETSGGQALASMTYNATLNRLESVTRADGTTDVHEYDASGYRVVHAGISIVWTAHGRPSSIGTSEALTWSATGEILSRTVEGATTRYRHGGAIREVDGALRLEDPDFKLDLVTGVAFFRLKDDRGNVKLVTDDNGAVVAHLRYGAFGLEEVIGADQRVHFVGRQEISHGLMLLGARLYDGFSFLSPDPVLQVFCQYCYTFADPIHWNDRTGTMPTGGEVLSFIGGSTLAVGTIAQTGILGATMLMAAPPLLAAGATLLLVGGAIVFFSSDSWDDGPGDDGFDGPGNGSGGNSPPERRHQCLCNGPPRGRGNDVDFGEADWLEGLWDSVGFGGFWIAAIGPGGYTGLRQEEASHV